MKKMLVVAALLAATAMPAAAEEIVIVDEAAVDAQCFLLPLLPDCAAQWNDYWLSKGYHVTTPIAWWTCKPADEGAGHLLACETN